MPYIKWHIEPTYLCRAPLLADKNSKNELQETANTTLVGILRQLACLVHVAQNVFSEIGTECKLVYHRTENLKGKVARCEKLVLSLNAKTAPVPVGNLSQFSQVNVHYHTDYDLDTRLFVSETRPDCVQEAYQEATANPIPVIRSIDQLRTDGCTGSRLFMCMPVFEDAKAKEVDLEIETRRPASFCVSREWHNCAESGYHPEYDGLLSDDESTIYSDGAPDQLRLPSPEERMLALSMEYPSTVVPIDVSGSTLKRMATFRRSLIHVDFFIRRKKKKKDKRRNTISEGDSKELQEALKKANIGTSGSQEKGHTHTSCQTEENSMCQTKTVQASQLFKRQEKTKQEENNNFFPQMQPQKKNQKPTTGLYEAVDLKVSKDWKPGKKEKNSKESKQLFSNKKQESESSDAKKSIGKSKGRSYIPISTLSAAMTVAVKMRQAFTGNKAEDVQSSSGNWSASSSQRTSMDSEPQHSHSSPVRVHSPSESSLSKDSVMSENTQQDTDTRSQDGVTTDCTSETSVTTAPITLSSRWHPSSVVATQFTTMDTETWLQSVEDQSPRQMEHNQSNSLSSLQTHFSNNYSKPSVAQNSLDDEDSSVFSIDADGYYTSMHTDSGLKAKYGCKLYDSSDDDDYDDSYGMGFRHASDTSISTIGNSSLNSLLSRTATELSSSSSTLTHTRKIPPPPPPRISSIRIKQAEDIINNKVKNENQIPQLSALNTDAYELEQGQKETEKFQKKTTINSVNYPSLCPISPAPSDDESLKNSHEQKTTKGKLISMISKKNNGKGKVSKESFQNEILGKINGSTGSKQNELLFNMYSDQSPQKAKFLLKFQERESPSPVLREKKNSLTSFLPANQNESSKETSFMSTSFLPQSPKNSTKTQLMTTGKATLSSPEGLDMVSTKSLPTNNVPSFGSLPLKYAHHITVTPISRDNKTKNTLIYSSPSCFENSADKKRMSVDSGISGYVNLRSPGSENSQNFCSPTNINETNQIHHISPLLPSVHSEEKHCGSTSPSFTNHTTSNSVHNTPSRPLRPTSLVPASANRPVARVTLDPNGQVIFSSNSLGRRRDGHPLNYLQSHQSGVSHIQKFATLPLRQNHIPNTISPISPLSSNIKFSSTCTTAIYSKPSVNHPLPSSLPISPPPTPITLKPKECFNNQAPSYQNISEINNSKDSFQNISNSNIPDNSSPFCSPYSSSVLRTPTSTSPSIDQSLLRTSPIYKTSPSPLTQRNIGLHSLRMNNFSPDKHLHDFYVSHSTPKSVPMKTSSSYSGSPFNNTNNNDSIGQCYFSQEAKRKTMTTEDLFAVIHNSKKRLQIKTDSDISASPISSRSSSPSSINSSVSKSGLAETGFLSPRNIIQGTPRDRRSWSGDTKSYSSTPGERRSLACDRFGPSKPTSMHDFKMLLLQTRSNSQNTVSRKSAVEQLMETAPQLRKVEYTNKTVSPSQVIHSTPCSPTNANDSSMYNGHSTVPLKRGCRARTSLQSRYLLYPPIWEDLSEDSENCHDFQNSVKNKSTHPRDICGVQTTSSNYPCHSLYQTNQSSVLTEDRGSVQYSGDSGGAGSSTWV